MDFNKKKILVTGGAGMVGSHLTDYLVSQGAQVTVVDDLSNGRMENLEMSLEKIKFVKKDVTLPFEELRKELGADYDGIFHLACWPRQSSLANPWRDLEVNARSTINMLELARLNKAKLVFTSNSGIYGNPEYDPIDENHPNKPSTPYDANKLVSEYYMKIYHKIYGQPIGICRLAAVYGERQRTKPDWKPVIPEFASKVWDNVAPTIYWDGDQTRDYIYVKDVVQGLTKAFLADTKDEIFLLSTCRETSINQIYKSVCDRLRKYIEPDRKPMMPGDIRRMKLSNKKAKEWLGFEPKYSIEQGIELFIEWFKSEKIKGK